MVTIEVLGQESIIYETVDTSRAREIFTEHEQRGNIISKYSFARGKESKIDERIKNKGNFPYQSPTARSIKGIEKINFFRRKDNTL